MEASCGYYEMSALLLMLELSVFCNLDCGKAYMCLTKSSIPNKLKFSVMEEQFVPKLSHYLQVYDLAANQKCKQ